MRKKTTDEKAIMTFIGRFTDNGRREEVIDCFMNGCCYWFARMLSERFRLCSPILMYAPVENHFGTEIFGRVYDITGDVTDKYEWMQWMLYRDMEPGQRKLIREHCIMF